MKKAVIGDLWLVTREAIKKLKSSLPVCSLLALLFLSASILKASGAGGAGASMACNGSAPYYCAPTDRAVRLIDKMAPPPVGVPFVLPESGETAIRLTGPATMTPFGSANAEFFGEAADTVPEWSKYDSLACSGAGGYRVFVQQTGGFSAISGVAIPFEVCPATNTVIKTAGLSSGNSGLYANGYLHMTNPSFSFGDPAVMYFQSGSALYSYCYPDASLSDPLCPNGQDKTTLVYDFADCPNLQTPVPQVSGAQSGTYTDATGRYVESASSLGQNTWGMIFRYDTQTGNCIWFDPGQWMWGGTGQAATHVNGGGLGDPTSDQGLLAAPTVTAVTGTGTLPAGTYYVKWTANGQENSSGKIGNQWNRNGQSAGSSEKTVILSATGELQVTPPSCYVSTSTWCNVGSLQPHWMLYAGTTIGAETLQNSQLIGTGTGSTATFSSTLTENLTPFTGSPSSIVVVAGSQVLYDSGSGTLCQQSLTTGSFNCVGSIVYNAGAITAIFAANVPNGVPVYVEWWYPPSTQETISAPISTAGPNAPTISTAGTGIHYANMNAAGTYFWLEGEGTNGNQGSIYWQIGTGNITSCTIANGCTGHIAPGFNTQISVACIAPVVPCTADLDTSPISNPSSYSTLMTPPPLPGVSANAWQYNTQHISWTDDNPGDTYPLLTGYSSTFGWVQPTSPFQFELFAATPFRPATVYRFAHPRSSGLMYMGGPNDFYHFSFGGETPDGKWADFSTTWNNSLGFLAPPWPASRVISRGGEYTDSNNNLEVETAASCTSGATAPAWPTTMGANISDDGTCSWVLLGQYGVPFAGPVWHNGVYYQAGAYVVDTSGNLQKETVSFCTSGTSTPSWTTTVTPNDGSCSWSYVEATGLTGAPAAVTTRVDVFAIRTQ